MPAALPPTASTTGSSGPAGTRTSSKRTLTPSWITSPARAAPRRGERRRRGPRCGDSWHGSFSSRGRRTGSYPSRHARVKAGSEASEAPLREPADDRAVATRAGARRDQGDPGAGPHGARPLPLPEGGAQPGLGGRRGGWRRQAAEPFADLRVLLLERLRRSPLSFVSTRQAGGSAGLRPDWRSAGGPVQPHLHRPDRGPTISATLARRAPRDRARSTASRVERAEPQDGRAHDPRALVLEKRVRGSPRPRFRGRAPRRAPRAGSSAAAQVRVPGHGAQVRAEGCRPERKRRGDSRRLRKLPWVTSSAAVADQLMW